MASAGSGNGCARAGPRYFAARSFVLKMWLEPREIKGQDPEWRARIDDVQTGKRTYFRTIEALFSHLASIAPKSTVPQDAGRGEDEMDTNFK